MGLSRETIEEYRQIAAEDYGLILTSQEASEEANRLLNYFENLIQIEHGNQSNANKPS